MPVIYETINRYNRDNGILPYRYIGSDGNDNPSYLGSSKRLRSDVEKLGVSNFEKNTIVYYEEIDNKELRREEAKLLKNRNVRENPEYYNLSDSYSPGCGVKGMKHTKQKIVSDAWRDPRKGWNPSTSTREKWSAQRTGKTHSNETKDKMSKSRTGKNNPMSSTWRVYSGDEVFEIVSLKNWCKEQNLSYGQVWNNRHPEIKVEKIKTEATKNV